MPTPDLRSCLSCVDRDTHKESSPCKHCRACQHWAPPFVSCPECAHYAEGQRMACRACRNQNSQYAPARRADYERRAHA